MINRQGDIMLENAIAELLQRGIIQRYMCKSVRVYRERRDVLVKFLKMELGDSVFRIHDGGMAVLVI